MGVSDRTLPLSVTDLEEVHDQKAALYPRDGETMSLWKLHLLAVSSLGLYLPFWVYRRAKLNGENSEIRSTPAWWGFGTFVAPVCCAVLYDFSGKAEAVAGKRRGLIWRSLPSILLAVILLFAFLLSTYLPPVATCFLLPIPFLIVQHRINASYSQWAEPVAIRSFQLAVRHWVLIILGLPAVLALWWFVDLPAYSNLSVSRLAEGTVITGTSGDFQLTTPSDDWRLVKAGTLSSDEAQLEIAGPGMATWIIVYRSDEPTIGIEETVASRRSMLLTVGKPIALDEKRYFLEGSDLVPVSLSRYRTDQMGVEEYVSLTAQLDSGQVEVLGYTAEPDRYSKEVLGFVRSLTEAGLEGEP